MNPTSSTVSGKKEVGGEPSKMLTTVPLAYTRKWW